MSKLAIDREDTVLVAIDFQEKLLPGVYGRDKLEESMSRLIRGCRVLGVPVLVTQQYTKGLGPTTEKIAKALTEEIPGAVHEASFAAIEKTAFSAMREPSFVKALLETGRRTVVIAGAETHICVQQTALDLIEDGYMVFGAMDCMSSRTLENKELGQIRMTQSGVFVTSSEAVLFDMLADSKDVNFKQISAIVK
ncbi:MAG: isochorismatase family protein [Clostridiales bacterium]|nr:isochorismatase family protein [Clostridiales bacterium]